MSEQQPTKTVTVIERNRTSARRRRRLVARVLKGNNSGEQFEVGLALVKIGRSRECEITLDDPSVSRVHAELHHEKKGFELRDYSSHNGTFINERPVRLAHVRPGDVIRCGSAELELVEVTDMEVPLASENHFGQLIGASEAMREVFVSLQTFARTDLNVLVTGETGTGKELTARALHDGSARANHPFLVVDCGALHPSLASSALFGHAKGAFTGADRAVAGVFEQAHLGTVFLDEVGELELGLQQMLLRVLELRKVSRLGEQILRPFDVRVIAATHRNLGRMLNINRFREDLYFRLVEGQIELPPLRARVDDIALLVDRMLEPERKVEPPVTQVTPDALRTLCAHPWPGNVRELRNVIRTASVIARSQGQGEIASEHLRFAATGRKSITLDELIEKGSYDKLIEIVDMAVYSKALAAHGGRITPAAESIGVGRKRFRTRMIELGLLKPNEDDGE